MLTNLSLALFPKLLLKYVGEVAGLLARLLFPEAFPSVEWTDSGR